MAVIKDVNGKNNSKGCLKNVIKYITNNKKTEEKLISGHNCSPETVKEEMEVTKMTWNKTNGRQFKHYVQSFNPKDNIDIEKAHEMTKKWVEGTELFKKHEVLIATHKDTKHIHSHIVVNSVSFLDGKKLSQSAKNLEDMKIKSNELSRDRGLTTPEKSSAVTTYDLNKYKALGKGFKGDGKYKSYVLDTAVDVSKSLKIETSREDFIKNMESKGYQVTWKDSRKNVTFKNKDGKKVRSSNLETTFKQLKFSKDGMENELQINLELKRQQIRESKKESFIKEIERLLAHNLSIENLKAIQFVKIKKVKSLQRIIDTVEVLNHKSGNLKRDLDKIRDIWKSKSENIVVIEKCNKLKKRIEYNKNNSEYKLYEMGTDKVLLETYQFMLKEKNLSSVEEQEKLKSMVEKIKVGYEQLLNGFEKIQDTIKEYDDCIETIIRADREGENKYKVERIEYQEFKEEYNRDDFERERERER